MPIKYLTYLILWFVGCHCVVVNAQENPINKGRRTKTLLIENDTVLIDPLGVIPNTLQVKDYLNNPIDSLSYQIDYYKGRLIVKDSLLLNTSLNFDYSPYPENLTKVYKRYDSTLIVPDMPVALYQSTPFGASSGFKPFDGLNTRGNLLRGITIGNNQNAVSNSDLDLQITGKLSDNVSIRASIQDNNTQIQQGGYSQKLDEFDQIFMEVYSDSWRVRAGDLFLSNKTSKFLRFNKKVQGIQTEFNGSKTTWFNSAALVRGQFARSQFRGQEANQGPYKLIGKNKELYVLVVSGSEKVYVNGKLLKRGQQQDYQIDYNAGEITFTPFFPITSQMRIVVEYQYSQQNYARIVSFNSVAQKMNDWQFRSSFFTEQDIKNQSLQQNLSEQQVQVLQQAGDDNELMVAPSAFEDTYSENKILYKKVNNLYFEYSNDPSEVLYQVKFSYVGPNKGNYVLDQSDAIGKIYKYIPPLAGLAQGDYEPVIGLFAPTRQNIAALQGVYLSENESFVDFELAVSEQDLNLFSAIDDSNNYGIGSAFTSRKRLLSGKNKLYFKSNLNWQGKNLSSIERLNSVEFNRDWNLNDTLKADLYTVKAGVEYQLDTICTIDYSAERLEQLQHTKAYKQEASVSYRNARLLHKSWFSDMRGEQLDVKQRFTRFNSSTYQGVGKTYHIRALLRLEDQKVLDTKTFKIDSISQRFIEYGGYLTKGDTARVHLRLGYLNRVVDSVVNYRLKPTLYSHSFDLKGRFIKTQTRELALYTNFRVLNYVNNQQDIQSLTSRLSFSDTYFKGLLSTSLVFDVGSGTVAQQEFTYVEVEPGKGVYMWNDYNQNGIQELLEFEIAPFIDQAKYIRVFLPNQVFINTSLNKISHSVLLNGLVWQNEKEGVKRFLSNFYNQSVFQFDNKIKRPPKGFYLNPWLNNSIDLLTSNKRATNVLFFHKGKQNHSVTYTNKFNEITSLLTLGRQRHLLKDMRFDYTHKFWTNWLINIQGIKAESKVEVENFSINNYLLKSYQLELKQSYLFNVSNSISLAYRFKSQVNHFGNETLKQQKIEFSTFLLTKRETSFYSQLSFIGNNFQGNQASSAGFQMLEGLQAGENITSTLNLQKRLTSYLDLILSYQVRASDQSKTVHNGSLQLKMNF